jgi:TolB-like protein/Tfp pilus assembly protein PilF
VLVVAMVEPKQQSLSYCFGDVVVERDNFRVIKREQVKPLEPRAFALLIYLIDHRGRVVEKQELFEQVWKESFVTDNALTQEIKNIRHVLGDTADSPRYIKTVHKHGYRFIAEVAEERDAVRKATPVPSIAVLPFVNLSADPENDYFCDGLAEELLNALTRVKDLRVVARTSAFSFKHEELDVREIARRLNATTVLGGSVQKIGNRLRVLTQLINADDGYHIWSERFDRQMDDVFAIQDEIALAIVDKLKVKLLADEKTALVKRYTDNADAYHLYLRGRYFWNKRFAPGAMQKALEYFHQAVEEDSHYALAYSGLADCYNLIGLWQFRAPEDVFPAARAAAEKALELDDTLVEAHTSLAFTTMLYDWDWLGAESEFKRGIELNTSYAPAHLWYAHYLCVMERFDEAIAEIKQAQDLDPLSLTINANAGFVLYLARKYKQAVEQLRKTLELDPSFGLTHFYLGLTLVQEARHEEAAAAFEKAIENSGGMPLAVCDLTCTYGRAGKRAEAERLLHEMETRKRERYLSPSALALIYLGLGEHEKFFECLSRAYEERNGLLPWIKILPQYDSVRSDPRCQDLLRRTGLAL